MVSDKVVHIPFSNIEPLFTDVGQRGAPRRRCVAFFVGARLPVERPNKPGPLYALSLPCPLGTVSPQAFQIFRLVVERRRAC